MPRNPSTNGEQHLRYIRMKLGIDVLFECFVGILVKCKAIKARDVHVVPSENCKRNFRSDLVPVPPPDATDYDIEEYSEHYIKQGADNQFIFYTSRSAVLDYLPEDFFAEPDNTDEYYDAQGKKRAPSGVKKYQEQAKEKLKCARRFFRPLEIEYNKVRIERELREVDSLENSDLELQTLWGDFPLHSGQWRRFVRTLHLVPFVLGSVDKTRALMEFVLDTNVSLILGVEPYCEITDEQREELYGEEILLGYNVNVGGAVFDYLETCTIRIENVSTSQFFNYFLDDGDGRKLLDQMINFYFPINVEIKLDFTIDSDKDVETENDAVVLGYSSKLISNMDQT